MASEHPTAG